MGSIPNYPESHWNVIRDIGHGKLLCKCDCGNIKEVNKYTVLHGKTLSCGCVNKFKPLKGKTINYWYIEDDIDKDYALCRCICGKVKKVQKAHLNNGSSKSCGCMTKGNIVDTVGNHYGFLTVVEELREGRIKCRCICGSIKEYNKYQVKNGLIKSCGCKAAELRASALLKDMTGQHINEWTILEELGHGLVRCQCDCGNIRTIEKGTILNGASKSCGHRLQYKDIVGKEINNWTVLEDGGYGFVKCRCSCGTIRVIEKATLLDGRSKSCGCSQYSNYIKTMDSRYGETVPNKLGTPRTKEQLNYIASKDNLRELIQSKFEYKPSIYELVDILGINEASVGRVLKRLDAYDLVYFNPSYSREERQVLDFIKSIYSGEVISNNRQVLNGLELDIYIPEKKLAIEYNGDYWHSSIFKDKKYHQQKTIACAKQGIRLIHIFEHEWKDEKTQEKIKNLLINVLQQNNKIMYGRKLVVSYINYKQASEFIAEYHISGVAMSSVNLGLFDNETLIGVMTFGKPRFNSEYEWELIRLCFKQGYSVVGGAEKMLNQFIKDYNPTSILTYCDISKFTGNSYVRMGFKPLTNPITEPNYIWISANFKNIVSRYQSQKSRLVEAGYGTPDMTEDDIMTNLNYFKVYDAGNIKLYWNK